MTAGSALGARTQLRCGGRYHPSPTRRSVPTVFVAREQLVRGSKLTLQFYCRATALRSGMKHHVEENKKKKNKKKTTLVQKAASDARWQTTRAEMAYFIYIIYI